MKLPTQPKEELESGSDIYHARYQEFKKKGHPFWPDIIFEDTIAIAVVLLAIIGLSFLKGVPLGEVADPTNREYIPRPEWYFMFLFQLLRYFPGSLEWVGIAVVPGVVLLLLFLLPFVDKRPIRSIGRRPLATGLAAIAILGIVFLTYKAYATTPPTVEVAGGQIRLTSMQQMGRNIYRSQGCASCHSLAGSGNPQGIPLDGVVSRWSMEQVHNYIENPKSVNPNAAMPSFGKTLTHQEVEAIVRYLSVFPERK